MDITDPTALFERPFVCFIRSLIEQRGMHGGRYRRHYVFTGEDYARHQNLEVDVTELREALRTALEDLQRSRLSVQEADLNESTSGAHSLIDHYSISSPNQPSRHQDVMVEMDLNGRFLVALLDHKKAQAA